MRQYLLATSLVFATLLGTACGGDASTDRSVWSNDSTDADDGQTGFGFADTQTTDSDGTTADDNATVTDAADGTDATDGVLGVDGSTGSDATTSTDSETGSDATDAVTAADATSSETADDATDGSTGVEAADGTTNTDATNGETTSDMTDGSTGIDAADNTSGTDTSDATDESVGTDGTDSMNGMDSTDGVDATTGGDATDGTDGTTGCQPVCAANWVCGPDGCGGTCGTGCAPGTVCNDALHICESLTTQPKQFGEYCGISGACVPTLDSGEDNPAWPDCANSQCESGICLFGYNGQQSVCSKSCSITADLVNGEGNPIPDGIDDLANNSLACAGAADGPYGTEFTCVQWVSPSDGQFLNLCQPGTTFVDCKADDECPVGEVCTMLYVDSQYVTKCQTARKNAGVGGDICNFDPYDGAVAYCQNDLCRAGYCLSFCNQDTDCTEFQYCAQDAQLYANVAKTFDYCQGAYCFSNGECPAGSGCDLFWNGLTGENAGWEPLCSPKSPGASFTGGACDGNTDDGIPGPECVGPCLASGTCSSFCLADDDCENPTQGMLCAIQEQDFDLEPENAPDGVPEFFLAYGLCLPAPGSQTPCFTDGDCGLGSGEICTFHEYLNVATGLPDGKGVCTTAALTEGAPGTLCGGDTGLSCQTGFCLNTFNDGSGVCSTLCDSADSCPKNISIQGIALDMACNSFNFADALTPDDPTDNVYVPLCQAFLNDPGDYPVCGADFSCASASASCIGRAIVFGSSLPGTVDYRCVDMTDPSTGLMPTGTLGATCDVDTGTDSPAGNGVSCQSAYCLADATGNDAGYCSRLCNTDVDCAGIPDAVCDQLVLIPRNIGNVGPNVCQRAVSCIPCDPNTGCAGDYVCANVGAAGALADMRCVPECSANADCNGTDGGSACVQITDALGNPTTTQGCVVDSCN